MKQILNFLKKLGNKKVAAQQIDKVAPKFPNIIVVNKSKYVEDADLQKAVDAIQIQLDRDFSPAWGLTANLSFGKIVPQGYWAVYILDTPDVEGALGYHDLDTKGIPNAKVFAKLDIDNGLSWSVTLSHEILEMVLDPTINITVFAQSSNTRGTIYAYEVADAVEDDQFGYKINDILVSDFVYPSWFESFWNKGETKFDHMGLVQEPFELLEGGYISVFNVPKGKGWSELTHASGPGKRLKAKLSREYSRLNQRK